MGNLARAIVRIIALLINGSWRNGSRVGRGFLSLYEKIHFIKSVMSPDGQKSFIFYISNALTLYRANTLFEKEPETIEWIDSFAPGSVYYDIGANVGVYTIYAGAMGKADTVLAFEPEAANYALLNRNVALNGLENRVTCLNIAFSDSVRLDYLHLSKLEIGAARHSFGGMSPEEGSAPQVTFKQGAISYSIDDFIQTFNPAFPNYIKIDVDGLETKILNGAKKTLKDPRMKSIIMEIDESISEGPLLADQVISLGYLLLYKKHARMFDGGRYDKVYNYVFVRKDDLI